MATISRKQAAKQLHSRIGKDFGYIDNRNKSNLYITKSVDVTGLCGLGNDEHGRVVLDFTQATDGIVVNVVQCNPGKGYGKHGTYFMSDLERSSGTVPRFMRQAESIGLKPKELFGIIERSIPNIDHTKLVRDFKKYSRMRDGDFEHNLSRAGLTLSDLKLRQ